MNERDLIHKLDEAKANLTHARKHYTNTIHHAHTNGLSTRAIGNILGVSHQTVWNIIRTERND